MEGVGFENFIYLLNLKLKKSQVAIFRFRIEYVRRKLVFFQNKAKLLLILPTSYQTVLLLHLTTKRSFNDISNILTVAINI